MSYPYDPQTREYVSRLLYQSLPDLYRVEDGPPGGRGQLEAFMRVWAAPLAALRQNIEELHSNFFIDTCDDWVLPYLAEMVGLTLIFPEARINRLDIRETVGWRKRKGSPRMLEDLAGTLSDNLAASFEGWKLVQLAQDLDDAVVVRNGLEEPMLLRRERQIPDLRDPIVAEKVAGPMVDTHHAADVRPISLRGGKYHPRHVFHYLHPTRLFTVSDGEPFDLRDPVTDPDLRFAFHPLGEMLELRSRRVSVDDDLPTDRVPPLHFGQNPSAWFGVEGRFDVRIAGLSAATQGREIGRRPSFLPASPDILEGNVTISVLEREARRFHDAIRISVVAAPFAGPPPDVPDTSPAAIDERARIEVDSGALSASAVVNNGALPADSLPMIRLQAVNPASRLFPGAVLEIRGDGLAAARASTHSALAQEGFLGGALFVRLPAAQVDGDRWFYLAADGSVVQAQSAGSGAVDVNLLDEGGEAVLEEDFLGAVGPGAAWPPEQATANSRPWTRVPPAPGRGAVVLHGCRALRDPGGGLQALGGGTDASLALALSFADVGVRQYRPVMRLLWQGDDPAGAAWEALDDDGLTLPAAQSDARFAELADWVDTDPHDLNLVVRFECGDDDALLTPGEVALSGGGGRAVLIHLPELVTQAGTPVPEWPTDAGTFDGASPGVIVGQDGSTWLDGAQALARRATGAVAPLAGLGALRRRRIAYRSLCQWRNEDPAALPPEMHQETLEDFLDVDPAHGLFAMAETQPPQPMPAGPDGHVAPSLTVVYQQGSTAPMGGVPLAREPLLDRRLETPTRIVSRGGHLHRNASAQAWSVPRYENLADALADIAAAPNAQEVVQIDDSATYAAQSLTWPDGVDELTVQAAEEERPIIEIQANNLPPGLSYQSLTLIGLSFHGPGLGNLTLPESASLEMSYCSVLDSANGVRISGPVGGIEAEVSACLLGPLLMDGAGAAAVRDSVVDSGRGLGQTALEAEEARVKLDRVTVFGTVEVRVLDASEVYFDDHVEVEDRFRGCVRYSRVSEGSVLPRRHRVVEGTRPIFVSVNRFHPAHSRLDQNCHRDILRGAEDGGEMGAFHDVQLERIYRGVLQRLRESTPVGLATGILRLD